MSKRCIGEVLNKKMVEFEVGRKPKIAKTASSSDG